MTRLKNLFIIIQLKCSLISLLFSRKVIRNNIKANLKSGICIIWYYSMNGHKGSKMLYVLNDTVSFFRPYNRTAYGD